MYGGSVSRPNGVSSGGPTNSVDAIYKSTVFDVDPTCKTGRVGGADDPQLTIKPFSAPYSSMATPGGRPVDISDGQKDGTQRSKSHRNIFGGVESETTAPSAEPSAGDEERREAILENLRTALRARGAVGIRGLARNFQICDTSHDKKLQRDELQKCFKLCRLQLSEADFEMLFNYIDADESGSVDYDEFLKVVRGPMPPLRRKLVGMVFRRIDQLARKGGKGQGDGLLTADDLMHAFSGREHPDVRAG